MFGHEYSSISKFIDKNTNSQNMNQNDCYIQFYMVAKKNQNLFLISCDHIC